MARIDNRKNDQIRDIKITRNYTKYAEGSVLIEKMCIRDRDKREIREFQI